MAKKWVCFLKDKSKPCRLVETEDKIMPSNIFADGAGTDSYYDDYDNNYNDADDFNYDDFIPIPRIKVNTKNANRGVGTDNGGGQVGNDDGDVPPNNQNGFLGGVFSVFDKVAGVAGSYYSQKSQYELQKARIDAAVINAGNTGNTGDESVLPFDEPIGKPKDDDAIPVNYLFFGGLALAAVFVGGLALKK